MIEAELLTYRLLAQQTGSGWTCRVPPPLESGLVPQTECEVCPRDITHHWIGAQGQQLWRCGNHPPED